jgi:putative hydrolase of the HAD superfamily
VPGSLDALRRLRHTGVPIVAITNTAHGRAEESLRANHICQVGHGPGVELDAIVDSARVGVKKPDPRIFDIALRAVSCSPSRVVHVGDSVRTDVSGALNAGIRPIHFDPHSLCTDRSHAHIMSLAEMVSR